MHELKCFFRYQCQFFSFTQIFSHFRVCLQTVNSAIIIDNVFEHMPSHEVKENGTVPLPLPLKPLPRHKSEKLCTKVCQNEQVQDLKKNNKNSKTHISL